MATTKDWIEGARLRTLPAAIGPVLLGVGAALHLDSFSLTRSLLALVTALALQVGVNYSNDYSDGVRGSDSDRVGPPRLTGGGLAKPKQVLQAALGCFALAALSGLILVAISGLWWLLILGSIAIAAAWFYTGGKNPYGYAGVGLSELMVFVFFGLLATVGTAYVQTYSAPAWLWFAASGTGLASVALLMVNNIRDIHGDTKSGKRTIAVRMGDRSARISVLVMLATSAILGGWAALESGSSKFGSLAAAALLVLAAVPAAYPIQTGATGRGLLPALRGAGFYILSYGIIVGGVFALGASNVV